MLSLHTIFIFFFFNDTATTEIYTLSLHDALPIYHNIMTPVRSHAIIAIIRGAKQMAKEMMLSFQQPEDGKDRKSTRLNSSHGYISYAVFCLKKKKKITITSQTTTDSRIACMTTLE